MGWDYRFKCKVPRGNMPAEEMSALLANAFEQDRVERELPELDDREQKRLGDILGEVMMDVSVMAEHPAEIEFISEGDKVEIHVRHDADPRRWSGARVVNFAKLPPPTTVEEAQKRGEPLAVPKNAEEVHKLMGLKFSKRSAASTS